MDLLWPGFLLLLGLIPLIVGVYVLMLRRRRRFAVRYSSLSLVRDALPRHSWLRRHMPFVLFLTALACLILALTRPVHIITIPTDQTTIILAIDVSGSMRSEDIKPNRLIAAENAALSFIQKQKSQTQIGLVAFSGFAELVQPPTTDQEALQSAVESLTVGRRTAIGSGILKSVEAVAEVDRLVAPLSDDPLASQPTAVPKGAYAPDIIVLLTDGVSNAGPLPVEAAQQAVTRGVRIYTIGFGTENGSIPFDQFQGGGIFGGGNNGGFGNGNGQQQPRGRFRTGIDEQVLKDVAAMTGGEYYYATSASELQKVFESLPTYLITKHEVTEVSVFFAAGGALMAALAIFLSLVWHPLP